MSWGHGDGSRLSPVCSRYRTRGNVGPHTSTPHLHPPRPSLNVPSRTLPLSRRCTSWEGETEEGRTLYLHYRPRPCRQDSRTPFPVWDSCHLVLCPSWDPETTASCALPGTRKRLYGRGLMNLSRKKNYTLLFTWGETKFGD